MKKTLLITSDFWPNTGGVANYYYNIVKRLESEKIVVLTSISSNNTGIDFKIYNQPFLYNKFWPKWLKCFFEAINIIKKEKIEINWVGEILPVGIVAYLIKKIYKIPYFVSLHGFDILLAKRSLWKRYITKIILNNAQFIAPNSEFTSRLLKNTTNNSNIHIIYPGIDDNFKKIDLNKQEEINKKYNLENNKIVLSVGRIVKRKNHKLIIEAVKILKEKIDNILCVIIGTGDNLDNLKTLVKVYNLEKNIIFLENISNNDLPYFYNASDVFVMASSNDKKDVEGFGIVYLEAGIFKKVVIASNSGGAKEIIVNNESGYLIDSSDAQELSDKIINIFDNKELEITMGQNIYNKIIDKFLWPKIVEKLKNLL